MLKEDEGQAEGDNVSDNISCSSQQTTNEFLKECSPYEEMEQPDSWDCDNDVVQPDDMEDSSVTESLCCSHETIVEDHIPKNKICVEEGSNEGYSEIDPKVEMFIPKENEVVACEPTDETNYFEENQSRLYFILFKHFFCFVL